MSNPTHASRAPADAHVQRPHTPKPQAVPAVGPALPLNSQSIAALQRSAGNASAARLISQAQQARNSHLAADVDRIPSALASSVSATGFVQRQPAPIPATPTGDAATDEPMSALIAKHLQVPVEIAIETKGPSATGYVKLNKASLKGSVKVAPSKTTDGDIVGGVTPGGKGGDKKGAALAIAVEAKKTAQTVLSKQLDNAVSDLVKSLTGKDNALKTELFAKAKGELKGGVAGSKPEFSTKIGYDFGVDAKIFGVPKVTFQVKLTLIGLKAKKGSKGFEFEGTLFAAEPSTKLSAKWSDAFTIQGVPFAIEGSIEWGAEFEPNWAKIAADAAADVGTEAAVMAAIDFALLAGPPLLAGFVIGSGIVMAGEKGELHRNILEAAVDTRSAAFVFAQVITGSDVPAKGPRAIKAHAAATAEIGRIAAASNMTPDALMTELRQHVAVSGDFVRILSQTRQKMNSAFSGEVRGVIAGWRKEHYVLSIWTTEEDDILAAERLYSPVLTK